MVLSLGSDGDNIPSIDFASDDHGEALFVLATDINANLVGQISSYPTVIREEASIPGSRLLSISVSFFTETICSSFLISLAANILSSKSILPFCASSLFWQIIPCTTADYHSLQWFLNLSTREVVVSPPPEASQNYSYENEEDTLR